MEYLIAFQLLCGCFAGFAASRKKRNGILWFFIGTALPVIGVVLALTVGVPRKRAERAPHANDSGYGHRRPSRCCGSYIPDCQGCPHFVRPLFDRSYTGHRKGFCKFFNKVLSEHAQKGAPQSENADSQAAD